MIIHSLLVEVLDRRTGYFNKPEDIKKLIHDGKVLIVLIIGMSKGLPRRGMNQKESKGPCANSILHGPFNLPYPAGMEVTRTSLAHFDNRMAGVAKIGRHVHPMMLATLRICELRKHPVRTSLFPNINETPEHGRY